MSTNQKTRQNLDDLILNFIDNKKPETIEQLVNMISNASSYSADEIIERILLLQSNQKIVLRQTNTSFPSSFIHFAISKKSTWFWIINAVIFSTVLSVMAIPENAFPLVYIRYTLGLLFVLLLPGYCAIRAILADRILEHVEQLVLSLGFSIFVTFALGLVLNFLPWGITIGPIVLGLATITLLFNLVALRHEYRATLQKLCPQNDSSQK